MSRTLLLRLVPVLIGGCLCVARPAAADTFKVGTSGFETHPTIQAAITAAKATPGDDVIRIQAGTYVGAVGVDLADGTEITLQGGWNFTFSIRSLDPSFTILDAQSKSRALEADLDGSALVLDTLTIENGVALDGGGLKAIGTAGSHLTVDTVVFLGNRAPAGEAVGSKGGGLYASFGGGGEVTIVDSEFFDNAATAKSGSTVAGGAVWVNATGSDVTMERNWFENNRCEGNATPTGSGCSVSVWYSNGATVTFRDSTVLDSSATGIDAGGGAGGEFVCLNAATALLERNQWLGTIGVAGQVNVQVVGRDDCSITQRGSLLTGGPANQLGGLYVSVSFSGAEWSAGNLTIADHDQAGLTFRSELGTARLYNSVVLGNGQDTPAPVASSVLDAGSNLFGVDPGFVNAAEGFFRHGPGSSALDVGDGMPPSGLSAKDLDGASRVQNGAVDLGPYEGVDMLFASGFETGDLTVWSSFFG